MRMVAWALCDAMVIPIQTDQGGTDGGMRPEIKQWSSSLGGRSSILWTNITPKRIVLFFSAPSPFRLALSMHACRHVMRPHTHMAPPSYHGINGQPVDANRH